MNKKQLIAYVQRTMGPGATRRAATAAVDAVLNSIHSLTQQGPVRLRGFGTFRRLTRPAGVGYDIAERRMKERPASSTLGFHAAKALLPPEEKQASAHPTAWGN